MGDINFSKKEPLALWKKDQFHKHWMSMVQKQTGQPWNLCAAAIALADYISDNVEKLTGGSLLPEKTRRWLVMLFLSKVVRALPSAAVVLLRYTFDATQSAIFRRFAYDPEKIASKRARNNPMNVKASYFIIMNCIEINELFGKESQFHTATTARNFLKVHDANIEMSKNICRLQGEEAAEACLDISFRSRTPSSWSLAMHHRLLAIGREGSLLGRIQVRDVPVDADRPTVLSTNYEQMKSINAAIHQSFDDPNFVESLLGKLNLTAVGATIVTVAEGMNGMDVSRLSVELGKEDTFAQ